MSLTSCLRKDPIAKRDGFAFALDRLAKDIPEAGKMKSDNFIDNSILLELEKEGFIGTFMPISQNRSPLRSISCTTTSDASCRPWSRNRVRLA